MVCNRCITAVRSTFENLGLEVVHIALGEITLAKALTKHQRTTVNTALCALGFEIIDDKKSRIIEQIKNYIIAFVRNGKGREHTNLSEALSRELHYDYNYLSNLFSAVEGTTIEQYMIAQKIERVKELLVYDELTLSEIAFQLNYSSVAYLSNQFKKVTGLTPGHFKKIRENRRKPLDEV